MNTSPVWVAELAERFWADAGPPPPFPRDLAAAITYAAPLSVVERPGLTLAAVATHLTRIGLPVPYREPDRPLRAALYCWRGSGFVFLDAADPPDERRFSLAHELAHFLRDADDLRRRVARALGPTATAILDGRPATTAERIHAILRNVSLAPHVHLMNRAPDGRPAGDAERVAEDGADRLAFELLAPAAELSGETDPASLAARLQSAFGLPDGAARRYAHALLPDSRNKSIASLAKFR